jgi:hypothetical protein
MIRGVIHDRAMRQLSGEVKIHSVMSRPVEEEIYK